MRLSAVTLFRDLTLTAAREQHHAVGTTLNGSISALLLDLSNGCALIHPFTHIHGIYSSFYISNEFIELRDTLVVLFVCGMC